MTAHEFVPGGETPAATAPTRPGDGGEQTALAHGAAPAGHVGAAWRLLIAALLVLAVAACGDTADSHAGDTETVVVQGPGGVSYFCVIAARDTGGGGIWCERQADR